MLSDDNGRGIIVDPGCYEPAEQQQLCDYIENNDIQIAQVINTHCHIDHILGNAFIKQYFQVPLAIPKGEKEVFLAVQSYAPVYGFHKYKEAEIDQYIDEHDSISFGDITSESVARYPDIHRDIWHFTTLNQNLAFLVMYCSWGVLDEQIFQVVIIKP